MELTKEQKEVLLVLVLVQRYEAKESDEGYDTKYETGYQTLLDKFGYLYADPDYLASHARELIVLDKQGLIRFENTLPDNMDLSKSVEYKYYDAIDILDSGYQYVDELFVEKGMLERLKDRLKKIELSDIANLVTIVSSGASIMLH